MLKKLLVAATSMSLAVSPAIAQSSAAAAAPQPTMEVVDGSELRGRGRGQARGFIIAPLVALTLIILGILLATGNFPFDDDDKGPRVSP